MKIKDILSCFSALISIPISYFFGSNSNIIVILLLLMLLDLLSGLSVSFFKKSKKTKSGGIKSSVMFLGIIKKICIIILISILHRIDILYNDNIYLVAGCTAFSVEEFISIIENFALLGIKIPEKIKNVIDVFNQRNIKGE